MASAAIDFNASQNPNARSVRAIAYFSFLSVFKTRPFHKSSLGPSRARLQRMAEAVNSLGEYLSGWLKGAIPVVVGSAIVTGITLTVQWTQAKDTIEVFKEQIKEIQLSSNLRFQDISAQNNAKFQEVTISFNERINAISTRLNIEDATLRDLAVVQARAQEQQLALKAQIEQRGKQRDDQLADIIDRLQDQAERLADFQQSLNNDRVTQARMSASVESILTMIQGDHRPTQGTTKR